MSTPTWNEEFELPDGSQSTSETLNIIKSETLLNQDIISNF